MTMMMKKLNLLLLGILLTVQIGYCQTPFNDFVALFPQRSLTDPIFNITTNQSDNFMGATTIPIALYNQVIFDNYQTPSYYDMGSSTVSVDFLGKLDTEGIENLQYDDQGNEIGSTFYYMTAYPLGKINLQKNNVTLLIAVRSIHAISLDIYNFDQSGKLLSILPLLRLGSSPTNIDYNKPLYDFRIESEGKIYQEYNGIDFYRERKYELEADGHFKVVWENLVDR